MSTEDNRRLIEHIYEQLSAGDSRALVDAMAEDVRWVVMGTTSWSGTYDGKQAVLGRLLTPLRARFADRYTASAGRIVAEGDLVVAEVRGRVTTTTGMPYNQSAALGEPAASA